MCSASGLELLAAVRGLECVDGPARVDLISASASLRRGVDRARFAWRRNDWRWERYGQMTPVRHADLWQRLDHALSYHEVRCRVLRSDAGHQPAVRPPHFVRRRARRPHYITNP